MQHDRVASEREFFDRYYRRTADTALDRFYDRSAGIRRFRAEIFARCEGRRVLEVGCGPGGHGIPLAERGGRVTGIDISETAVELATRQAEAHPGLTLNYQIGNAEALEFPDGTFDLVCGTGIIHHLDVDRFARELRRVLNPSGAAVFYEPAAYSPIAAAYRLVTPSSHTPDEHPMVPADFPLLRRHFKSVDATFFHLTSSVMIPLLKFPFAESVMRALETIEAPILRLPAIRWLGAFTVIVMTGVNDNQPAAAV